MKKTFVYDTEGHVIEETTVLDDTDIRLKLLEMSKRPGGELCPQDAFEAEHYVRKGELIPYSQLHKAVIESRERN